MTCHPRGKTTGIEPYPAHVFPTGPPIHNMGLCSRLGEDPNAWKHFRAGTDPGTGNRASA